MKIPFELAFNLTETIMKVTGTIDVAGIMEKLMIGCLQKGLDETN